MRLNLLTRVRGAFSFWRCFTPVSAYPLLTLITPSHFEELEPDFPVTMSPEFADGTSDFNVAPVAANTRRFLIRYTIKTEAEALTIINHAKDAKYNPSVGSALSFGFTTRTGEVLAGVRYDKGGLKYVHTRTWNYSIEVILIDRP